MNTYIRNGKEIDIKEVKVIYSGPYIFTFKGFRDVIKAMDEICELIDPYYGVIYTRDSETIFILDDAFNMHTQFIPLINKRLGYAVEFHPDRRDVIQIQSKRYQKHEFNRLNKRVFA